MNCHDGRYDMRSSPQFQDYRDIKLAYNGGHQYAFKTKMVRCSYVVFTAGGGGVVEETKKFPPNLKIA